MIARFALVLVLPACGLACAPPGAPVDPVDVDVALLATEVTGAALAGEVVVVERAAGVSVLGAAEVRAGRLLDAATVPAAPAGAVAMVALSSGLFVVDAAAPAGLAEASLAPSFAEPPALLEACGAALYLASAGRLFRYVEAPAPELLELDVGFAGATAGAVTSATCSSRAGEPVLVLLVAALASGRAVVELDTARAPAATFRGEVLEAFAAARIAEQQWVFAAAALVQIEDGRPEIRDGTGAQRTLVEDVAVFAADAQAAWLDVAGVLHRGDASDGVLRAARGDIGTVSALRAGGDGSALVVDVTGALARVRPR